MVRYVVKVREHGAKGWHSTIQCNSRVHAEAVRNRMNDFETDDAQVFVMVPAAKGWAYIAPDTLDQLVPEAPTLYPGPMREMFDAMRNGRKIDAIREYRAMTGEGLKESKDAIESIMDRYPRVA